MSEHGVEQRALVWAPGRDALLTCEFLTDAGFEAFACTTSIETCHELDRGAGVVVVAAECLSDDQSLPLRSWLARQPAWSDIPVLVIAGRADTGSSLTHIFDGLGSVSVLH